MAKITINKNGKKTKDLIEAIALILNRGFGWIENETQIEVEENFTTQEETKISDLENQTEYEDTEDNSKYDYVISLVQERAALIQIRDHPSTKQKFKTRAQNRINEINPILQQQLT